MAQPGWVLISGDYRQQELRLMAHFSKDSRLCEILRAEGDPFQMIAADWHGIPASEVPVSLPRRDHQLLPFAHLALL